MKRKYMLLMVTLLSLALVSSVTVATFPPWTPLPRLDTQYFTVIKTEAARVDALTVAGTVEMIPGPGTTPNINKVLAWGANMSWSPSASYGFGGLQCRDVWPAEAAGGDEGKVPGQTTSPMNYSGFRVALTYIFGMEAKNASIWNYVQGPQTYGIKCIIPPAQAYWYDNTAWLPNTDFDIAWDWMEADGFYVDAGILYDARGVACRDLICYYSAGATAWEIELPDYVAAFNDFMDNYLEVTNCNLDLKAKAFDALVYGNLLQYHDFDMIFLGLTGLGPDPDWCISMFHSDYDVVWGWNFAGVHDSYMDYLLEIVLRSMDPLEILHAIHEFQHYFNGEMTADAISFGATGKGFFPHYIWSSGMAISSYDPHVMNYIDMPCWGSEQCAEQWSFVEYDSGYTPAIPGAIRRALGDNPTSINPFYENTLYGWLLMDGLEEGLLTRNPLTLAIQPWLAQDYSYEGPINTTTPEGKKIENGMKITFYIRPGIYWQDSGAYEDLNDNDVWDVGEPKYTFEFTAYDCQFAANMMLKYKPGRYDVLWTDLIETQTEGPYKLTVWYNASGYWYANYPSSLAMFPQHIYQKADKMVDDGLMAKFSDFKPYTTPYEDWTGCHAPDEWGAPPTATGYWTALVGTGPFIFGYFDPSTGNAETVKNTRYWMGQSPLSQSLETCAEHYGLNRFKKELVGDVITLENVTWLYPFEPVCSYWHEIAPTLSNEWHIDSWKDLNDDGVLSVCDEIDLSKDVCGNGQWVGQGEYHVESLIWDAVEEKWIMTVKEVLYVSELTSTAVVVEVDSRVWKRGGRVQHWELDVDVKLEVFCDDIKVGEAFVYSLGPFENKFVTVPFTNWLGTPPMPVGKHVFRIDYSVKVAGSVQPYEYTCSQTRTLAYLPGDANGDGIVNMLDIYTHGIKNFLYACGDYAWDHYHNEKGTGPGLIPPAKTADVNNDCIVNMIDIYRMIIMFMKSDP